MGIDVISGMAASIRDLLAPPACVGCDRRLRNPEALACENCAPAVDRVTEPTCPTCAMPQPWRDADTTAPCRECREHSPPQTAGYAYWLYRGIVATAVQAAKYTGDLWRLHALARPLRDWCDDLADELAPSQPGDRLHVTAVPMHDKDLRDRGFNAAVQLGRVAFAHARPRIEPRWGALREPERRPPQAGLTRGERRRNVRGAFEVRDRDRVAGRTWLVVDDVATTGATLAEAAAALDDAGARDVFTLAVARTPRDTYIGNNN